MWTSCLVEREAGLPLSLPPSSIDVRLEVEEAELGRGLVGSLVISGVGVLVNTCVDTNQDEEQEQVTATWLFICIVLLELLSLKHSL